MKFQQMDIARVSRPRELIPEGFHKVLSQSSACAIADDYGDHDVIDDDCDYYDFVDGDYDQIFSLYCLHWVKDLPTAVSNIHQLLVHQVSSS